LAEIIHYAALLIALLAVAVLFIRLSIGPTLGDRAVAIDAMTIVTISIITFIAHGTGREIYIDVALVYSLVSFIGIIALARYMEGGI